VSFVFSIKRNSFTEEGPFAALNFYRSRAIPTPANGRQAKACEKLVPTWHVVSRLRPA
jgi:hypothetical protein